MWSTEDDDLGLNPYESFMKKHLQHYGYFTGRNQNYRNAFRSYHEWEKNYGYDINSSDSSDSDNEKDNQDNKLQEELLRTTQLVYSYEAGRMVPRLREPRNLYALAKELGPQQAARWPSDVQVVDTNVAHIRYIPPEPEPFYKQTGLERTPMVRGEEHGGQCVFNYDPKNTFFVRSRVGGAKDTYEQCSVDVNSREDTTLVFESRFESGNLAKAVKVAEYDYELTLRYDLYTNKHTQWFYFRVKNTRANVKYRFSIVNFIKSDSLYNCGMKPVMYSEKDALQKKIGWVRTGFDIKYYRNNLKYETARGDRPFYSLSFSVVMNHNYDTVYFAHCYPYTYTNLQDYLLELANDPMKSQICKQRVLCRTLAGNLVYVLTITSPSTNPEDIKHKKAVVLTSRVHPGESNASFMMKGFLDYLTGHSADAKLLRDTFIFKIVPMMNPDGVIVGNYRCSLTGRDLNRNYKTVLKDSYPSVWHTKNMIRRLLQEREIVVYCDLHGHSRKNNVFIYGCENRHNPQRRLRERIFPCMLNKNAPDKFSFDHCKFKVQKSKEGTGRIVMWNMGIMNSYTMEATFCGSSLGKKKGFHFSMADYEALGYHFCDTLLDYCDPDNSKCVHILSNLEDKLRMEILAKMEKEGLSPTEEIDFSDYSSDLESSDGGSDSSVSDGPPVQFQLPPAKPAKKKKKLKSRKERDKQLVTEKEQKKEAPVDKKSSVGAQTKPEKFAPTPLRYTSSTPKRPRSQDERTNNGIPIFAQERSEERQQRRVFSADSRIRRLCSVKTDYLEALTEAYLKNGIPLMNEQVPHLRYSGTNKAFPNIPLCLEGLCPHHEQAYAEQYVACQLQNMQYGDSSAVSNPEFKGGKLKRLKDKRQQDKDLAPVSSTPLGNSYFKIWKILTRNRDKQYEDDYLRSQSVQSPLNPLDRRQLPRHLVEVSAAQQRQQDLLKQQGEKKNFLKQHPNPFDEKFETRKDRTKSRIPSATFVSYDTYNSETSMFGDDTANQDETQDRGSHCNSTRSHRTKSGRKSRMGMHEGMRDEEENMNVSLMLNSSDTINMSTTFPSSTARGVSETKLFRANSDIKYNDDGRRKSAREIMRSSVCSIRSDSANPTNESYINKLMKETNDEIESLTTELRGDIEKKKMTAEIQQEAKQLQEKVPIPHTNSAEHLMPNDKEHYDNFSTKCDLNSTSAPELIANSTEQSVKLNSVPLRRQMTHSNSREFQGMHRLYSLDLQENSVPGEEFDGFQEDGLQVNSHDHRPPDTPPAGHARSAKCSSRQVLEAIPTKISLMICRDHHDTQRNTSSIFRNGRSPFYRTHNVKRK
ncbi:cytosolic carboxypeptidase 2-like [Gigantopelta aegis]|uniref:cytosolic carboxypeptidase 2-like n=1 Tax=Gigantopelta aegis TaxID=1735272 RepID=UPI001B887A9C|nr:cytosolic carboxypeptidase 2-like [Gigantopelta aegis]